MRIQFLLSTATYAILGACGIFMAGCQEEEKIKVVQVPAEYSERRGPPPSLPSPSQPASESVEPGETGGLNYKTPEGWKVKPNGPMRLASFDIVDGEAKCDVSVIRLGPDQSVLDNVNRWRGQIKLAPVAENELALTEVKCGGQPGSLVELTGETESILAVMVARSDATWFLKLQGPNALARQERDRFVAFAESCEIP